MTPARTSRWLADRSDEIRLTVASSPVPAPGCAYSAGVITMRYVLADVFTNTPFGGNQLAVFTDAREIPEEWLQPLTREFNFSETAFVYPPTEGGHVRIRIFTPGAEIPFAGHPVLGAAFVLAGPLQLTEIVIETGAGNVPVSVEREGPKIIFGWMRPPVPEVSAFAEAEELVEALGGVEAQLPIELYDNGLTHVMVRLESAVAVANLEPDMRRLARMPHLATSCFAGSGSAFVTRMFAPALGVPKDAATGSAAGPVACHLLRHGEVESGQELTLAQGEKLGRPSELTAIAHGSATAIEGVVVGGSAVVVARGEFKLLPPGA